MLGYSYWASFHNAYGCLHHAHYRCRPQLPYKSHRTYLTNHIGSISHHITPLVIHSLRGGHTHTDAYRHSRTEAILRNQARAWFKSTIGYIYIYYITIQSDIPYYLIKQNCTRKLEVLYLQCLVLLQTLEYQLVTINKNHKTQQLCNIVFAMESFPLLRYKHGQINAFVNVNIYKPITKIILIFYFTIMAILQ